MEKKDKTTIELLFVPIDAVEPNPYNPNIVEEDKGSELKRLMKATNARAFFGRDPLRASPYDVFYGKTLDPKEKHEGRYVFIDGEHRWLYAKEIGWTEVGIAVENMIISQARQETYSRNYLRGNIDPVKEAKLFQDEVKDGLTLQQIADKYFKDPSYVSKSLSLLTLPDEVLTYLYKEEDRLTKSHLEQLIGLPEENVKILAGWASNQHWTAKHLEKEANKVRERIEQERRLQEAMSHFILRECPVCGAAGTLDKNMTSMRCSEHYSHYELKLRKSLEWGPLDTKEGMLKRRFKLDDGRNLPLEDIIKISKQARAVPKRKPDWFKHEKAIDELMPRIHAFAYEMVLANRANVKLEKIQVSGKTKEGGFFNVDTTDRGIWVHIGDKELAMFFESKEWKRGNFKTRVNVRGVEEEAGLKKVQIFLDSLMRGDAKVEDYPFEARKKRIVQAPSLDEPDEESDEEVEDRDKRIE